MKYLDFHQKQLLKCHIYWFYGQFPLNFKYLSMPLQDSCDSCPNPTQNTIQNAGHVKLFYLGKKMKILRRLWTHSSQFQSLCLMKSSSETLQNLPCFIYRNILFSIESHYIKILFMEFIREKIKKHEMKNGKSNFGFSYT